MASNIKDMRQDHSVEYILTELQYSLDKEAEESDSSTRPKKYQKSLQRLAQAVGKAADVAHKLGL